MTVLDVLKTSSLYLNMTETFSPIFNNDENVPEEATKEFAKLVTAFNNTLGYIASNYFDVLSASVINISSGEYDLGSLTHKCLKVISLTSDGKKIKFEIENSILKTKFSGGATITYSYIPSDYDEEDNIDILYMIDLSTFAMGVSSEYSYMNAIYDDAQMWHERFVDSLKTIKSRLVKNAYIMPRRWL